MDPFTEEAGHATGGDIPMAPGHFFDLDAFQALASDIDKSSTTWDHLKVQLNPFNQIISIPAAIFHQWSVVEKQTIQLFMM